MEGNAGTHPAHTDSIDSSLRIRAAPKADNWRRTRHTQPDSRQDTD